MSDHPSPRSRIRRAGLLGALAAVASPVHAQSAAAAYPTKPIRMIVPFATGGPTDVLARAIGQKLTERWGQTVLIDNRPGAGGNIGAELAARAAPDGYTLMLATAGILAVNPSLSKVRFDSQKDFAPIALTANLTSIMVVHPSLPVKSVRELIQLAKSRPGELNYGSAGNGTASHLSTEKFKRVAQIDMKHIPYKGAAPAVNDLLSGTVQVMLIGLPTVMPHVAGGRLVALGISSLEPSPMAPGLPTIADSGGLPGFEVTNWLGLVAPAQTDRVIVDRLNREVVAILAMPDVKQQLLKSGFEPTGSTQGEFAKLLDAELKTWARVIREAGITND
jgi:tripartite-type tricarboxylate transporter receptor subunit TctC